MDGGSTPPRSTKSIIGESQQNQAIAFDSKGCSFFRTKPQLVSNGPDWSPKCHHSDTNSFPELDGLGTRECKIFRNNIFNRHPYISKSLAQNYLRIHNEKSLREANQFIRRIDNELTIHDLNLSSSPDDIRAFCEDKARICHLTTIELGN